jgi:hypothetical protein
MRGQIRAITTFNHQHERLIRHIDRIRKGAKKPDEKKPPHPSVRLLERR